MKFKFAAALLLVLPAVQDTPAGPLLRHARESHADRISGRLHAREARRATSGSLASVAGFTGVVPLPTAAFSVSSSFSSTTTTRTATTGPVVVPVTPPAVIVMPPGK
jgi:hypothetical protein